MGTVDLGLAEAGTASINIIDFEGDEERPDFPPPPAAASPPPPLPCGGFVRAAGTKCTVGPAGSGSVGAGAFLRGVSGDVDPGLEFGGELSRRLERMDGKLDWLVARVRVLSIADVRPSSNADGSPLSSFPCADFDRIETLRTVAGGGQLAPMEPPPVLSSQAPAGPGSNDISADLPGRLVSQDSVDRLATASMPVTHQMSGHGGALIPNLNKRPGKGASARASGRSSCSGYSRTPTVPTMFKNQFLARRMYEKSDSKDVSHVQKRIESLPKAMRKTRYKVVDYVFTVLDDPQSSRVAWWTAFCLQALVLLSVLGTLMQTVEDPFLYGSSAAVFETAFDVVFLTEVCIRWACAPNRVNFVFMPQTWIDIVAASAIAVRAAVGFVLRPSQDDWVAIFLLCFVPIIRLLKILRHFETFNVLIQAVKITMEALPMLMYAVALVTMTFATLIYLVEPELFESPFRAVWFCLVTVTTVGYGDYSPVTTAGITIAMVLIVLGVILMAVPVGIIGMTFHEEWNARDYSLLLRKTRMKLHQWGYTAHDIPNLFKIVDSDENGVLELDEFCELVKEMKIGLSEDRIIALFEHMDKDGSGALDAAEFALEVFPETFIEAFGHAGQTNPSRDSTHWMSSLAAAINGGKSFQREMPGVTVINED